MKNLTILILIFLPAFVMAQNYRSNKSHVRFYSEAPLEDIEAVNNKGTSIFNPETGEIVFSIPIKGFQFEKSLMQEHFNENYLESDKYPEATFKGTITGYDKNTLGTQNARASGTMKIHGVEKEINVEGKLTFNNGMINIEAQFPIEVADYDIEIPKVVFYNIAEVVDVTVKFDYEKL